MKSPGGICSKLLTDRLGCLLLAAAAWCGGFGAFVLAVGPMSALAGPAGGLFFSSVICMASAFLSLYVLLRGRFHLYETIGLFAFGAVVNLLVDNVLSGLAARLVTGFSLIAGGYGVGMLLARMVESARFIVPMCVVAVIADVWSAVDGPTKEILETKNPIVLRHVFVSYPGCAGTPEIGPVAGVADIVFVAVLLCVAARLGLGVRHGGVGMFAGLVAGLAAAQALGGVPGVPFVAAGFVVANWKKVRPGRDEILTTSLFIAVMLAVFATISIVR